MGSLLIKSQKTDKERESKVHNRFQSNEVRLELIKESYKRLKKQKEEIKHQQQKNKE